MIIDFNNPNTLCEYETDICIVGSGAASLAILTKLYNSGLNVIVLEAGGENITDKNQEIYDVITPNLPFYGAKDGRFRVFGGSTTIWGGNSMPLEDIDFRPREWVPNSGWPISNKDLEKYYTKVDDFLNLHPAGYESDVYKLIKTAPLPLDEDMTLRFSKGSPTPNLREKFRKQLVNSTNILVIQNANLTRIELHENHKSVQELTFKNFDEKTGKIKAKKFILACGGIENARLLLASNHQEPNGIGNKHDLVGRYLQDHPKAFIGDIVNNTKKTQNYFNYFYLKSTRCLPRFVVSENFQTEHKILNASAIVKFETEAEDPFSLAKEIYRKKARGTLTLRELKIMARLVKHLPQMYKIGKKYLMERKVYTPNANVKLSLMLETPPLRENRVLLSDQKDALGMPKSIISWNIDELMLKTMDKCATSFKTQIDRFGLGELKLEDWLKTGDWRDKIDDSNHHIGTTRMSESQLEGVVDKDCKVHNINNLYIAGSSVFPTSGHSNPTFTIIALGFRLAELLIKDLAVEA